MTFGIGLDRIQFFSIIFSVSVFSIIFSLVKNRRVKEEYALLWLALSLAFLYLSLDRYAVDRLGDLFGIAYKPSVLMLIIIGFMTLVMIHITIVITRISDQNRELVQELALSGMREGALRTAEILIIVPAYNEAGSIGRVIDELQELAIPIDILVVNDGSRDETSRVARERGRACVIDLPANLGIGGAVQTGFKYASRHGYSVAIQFDGDGQHVATEIPKLLRAMRESGASMVIGSRFLKRHAGYRSTVARRLGIRLFALVSALLIGQRITDSTSGFRAYNQQAIRFLALYYPVDYPEPEAAILLGKNGFVMREEFAVMRERQEGGSSIAGFTSAYYMVKVLLAMLMTALRKPIVAKK